ncbi:MAG: paraquat-inducible protein A [Candidatus Omnitrophica bacterium]|nr:paraquat-inducible protein A [Candidatus Omnitrophota bacterium]
MATSRKSLREFYPRHYEVLLLLIAATAALVMGLSLPLVKVEKLLLVKRATSIYSVYTGVVSLWKQGEYFLAGVIFFFSIIFPFMKIASLSVIWFFRMADSQRKSLLQWLEGLGRWSMLDVFIVSILIVAVKLKPLVSVEAKPGVYIFALAILLSMIATMWVDRLAKRALR